ncbi:MAG: FAD-dependent thymidylate synthase [Patescibacteria group bacterium]|nr:FAD-dependent thymidylate synthase [Patescibacteria group bacterium]
MLKTTDFKIRFLGTIPVLTDKDGVLTPEQIAAFSALLTFKGKTVKQLWQEAVEKGQSIEKKTQAILNHSSLRGHASIATTPTIAFYFEGSKFLDSMLTGIIFSSSLMASGRRTETTVEDIVYSSSILKNQKAKKIYQRQAEEIINFFNFLLKENVIKDEASKILQYGIYGTGIMVLPVESVVGFWREYQMEKDWLPEEGKLFLEAVKKEGEKLGIANLLKTRFLAPRDIYPYPNIFKNPADSNLVRELEKEKGKISTPSGSKIIDYQLIKTRNFKKELKKLIETTKKISQKKETILKDWRKTLALRRKLARDYNLNVEFLIYSSCAWRVWGEKKRHRTVPQIVESIYYMVEKALHKISEIKKNPKTAEKFFSIPTTIKNNPSYLKKYSQILASSLKTYQELINLGIDRPSSLFIIPRSLKINVLQKYNLYNLISGYYPTRLCSTVEPELKKLTWEEVLAIKKILEKEGLPELAEAIAVKCQTTGFCHETKFCPLIKTTVKNYDEDFHKIILTP